MSRNPRRVLFAHVPKAAGSYLTDYFKEQLGFPWIQSQAHTQDGVWMDFTVDELLAKVDVEHGAWNRLESRVGVRVVRSRQSGSVR